MMGSPGEVAPRQPTICERMSQPPHLLAIDCATLPASVAVVTHEGTLAESVHDDDRRSDAWLGGGIEACLAGASLTVGRIDGFAVSVGPGTFTGIRVGIATALGLAAPHALPVAGIITLDAVALIGLRQADLVVACIDARRGQVYAALYAPPGTPSTLPLVPQWGPAVCRPDDLPTLLTAEVGGGGTPANSLTMMGSGAPLLAQHSGFESVDGPLPLAAAVGHMALRGWPEGADAPLDWPPADPLYLRPLDATPRPNPLLENDG